MLLLGYSRIMTIQPSPNTISIAILIFDGVNAVDVTGPLEAFASARISAEPAYSTETWAIGDLLVRTESGLTLRADQKIPSQPHADILIVPGGRGLREPSTLSQIAHWLQRHHHSFARIVSVCTGTYALAEAALLDGRVATTHWAFAEDLQRRYPALSVNADALFVRDGKFYSSGGITAGIDLALDIIESDCGFAAAMEVARVLVVFLRRTGAQAQFSAPLKLQSAEGDRLSELVYWVANNLHEDLSVERMAAFANLSPRQFTRRFSQAFSCSPAQYVKQIRLDAARTMLGQGCGHLNVATAVGFHSNDGFRRAFAAKYGLSPKEYQRRFCQSSE